MLQSFLSQHNASLVQNYAKINNQTPLQPSSHQLNQPCWVAFQPSIPHSPNYKRKKIFQPIPQQSKVTAGFKQITLEESKVEIYQAPHEIEQQKVQKIESRLECKKKKTSKENGLCLGSNNVLCLKKHKLHSLQTIPSTLNEIMPESAQEIAQNKRFRKKEGSQQSQSSLWVMEGEADLFTFNSEPSISLGQSSSVSPFSIKQLNHR